MRTRTLASGMHGVALTSSACVSVPLRQRADFRKDEYFARHRDLPPDVAKAIDAGHVILGRDREQGWTVLGDPVRKAIFSSGRFEAWLYPAHRLHQDQLHSHGADSFRLIFIDGRLAVIEFI